MKFQGGAAAPVWVVNDTITYSAAATPGTLTNRSGTITSGGNSQQIMASNAARIYLFVQNVSDTDMWLNFNAAANADQPSIRLVPGASFVMEGTFISTEAVNLFCATTGKAFTAKEA